MSIRMETKNLKFERSELLTSLNELYTQPYIGISSISELLSEVETKPDDRLTILLIGNHSAGKSSFVNWYTGTAIQSVGVAMETQNIELVLFGPEEESLNGESTFKLVPSLECLRDIEGIEPYLKTHICPSQKQTFHKLCFIDTPGLVDGVLRYPFDIDRSLMQLGRIADLIFVFFEPVGQTMCKRTMNIIEGLERNGCTSKIQFIMNKADLVWNTHTFLSSLLFSLHHLSLSLSLSIYLYLYLYISLLPPIHHLTPLPPPSPPLSTSIHPHH